MEVSNEAAELNSTREALYWLMFKNLSRSGTMGCSFGCDDWRRPWRTAMSSEQTPLTQAQREEFWRTMGWRPDLSQAQRQAIEQEWDDASIRMAESFGY